MALAPTTISTSLPAPTIRPISSDSTPNCISFLKSCSNIKEFAPIHAHLITTNLINNPLVASEILHFFISIENTDQTRLIFDQIRMPETLIWNTLIENHLRNQDGDLKKVFLTYYEMVSEAVLLDITTFHFLIHACSKDFDIRQAREVHGRILKSGYGISRSLKNNLMGMYSKAGRLKDVRQLFDKSPERDIISWNTMISCYVRWGFAQETLDLFEKMIVDGVKPDEITMVSLISACTKLRDLKMGEKLRIYIEENHMEISGSLLNCLVDMYIKCGEMKEAYKLLGRCESGTNDVILWTTLISGCVKIGNLTTANHLFNQMTNKNLITWTTMISGYFQSGFYDESLEFFVKMRLENVIPDEVAIVTALSSCAEMENIFLGRSIHCLAIKYGMIIDGFLSNSLIDMYAKCEQFDRARLVFDQLPDKNVVSWNTMLDGYCREGDFEKARTLFDKMPKKDIVSWNTMINFYSKFGRFSETFEFFIKMQNSNVKPDSLTLISLLSCCACVGSLNHGIWVHVFLKRNQIEVDEKLATSLIDMFGKCGSIEKASDLFKEVKESKNVFLWTAMISAYAMEGQAHKVIDLYEEMEERGIKPDDITFISLLSACSHGGLVDEGHKYFNKMCNVYKINPKIQHYGCMVDLLGRTGQVEKALHFIKHMPIQPDKSIWSALLRACVTHHNVQVAEFAFKSLLEIDPLYDSAYILLSNIYAKAKRYDDMSSVRMKLNEKGIIKNPGCSMIECNGAVLEFRSWDFSNVLSDEIYSMLSEIEGRLNKEELREEKLSTHHSEKLAVAYGLISSPSRTTIRVVNNLRMCKDCHSDMKIISKVYNREIVIRENYRFHRFQKGTCSCNDQW